jgi:hypothetical protein
MDSLFKSGQIPLFLKSIIHNLVVYRSLVVDLSFLEQDIVDEPLFLS